MTEEDVFRALCDAVVRTMPEVDRSTLSPMAMLQDLGANSLDRLDIMLDVKEALGVGISVRDLTGALNMAGIAALLYRSYERLT